jgi:shikimate kinase
MIFSFIGMAGAGKSFWSDRLEKEKGYQKYSCDELIEKELAPELALLGYKGTSGLSSWMGQQYDERYVANSQRYLELEAKVLGNSLKEIENNKNKNIVVDTTGSVVYLPLELIRKLKQLTKIVYLETPEFVVEKMINLYLADPKPVIWGNLYKPLSGEDKMETLKRCYPELLKYRANLYDKLADVKVDYSQTEKSFTLENLLNIII